MARRVLCILKTDYEDEKVYVIGEGNYVGDEIPDESAEGLSRYCRETGRKNPKIELDAGGVVWGCECWWDDIDVMKSELDEMMRRGWEIVPVNMADERELQRAVKAQ